MHLVTNSYLYFDKIPFINFNILYSTYTILFISGFIQKGTIFLCIIRFKLAMGEAQVSFQRILFLANFFVNLLRLTFYFYQSLVNVKKYIVTAICIAIYAKQRSSPQQYLISSLPKIANARTFTTSVIVTLDNAIEKQLKKKLIIS